MSINGVFVSLYIGDGESYRYHFRNKLCISNCVPFIIVFVDSLPICDHSLYVYLYMLCLILGILIHLLYFCICALAIHVVISLCNLMYEFLPIPDLHDLITL